MIIAILASKVIQAIVTTSIQIPRRTWPALSRVKSCSCTCLTCAINAPLSVFWEVKFDLPYLVTVCWLREYGRYVLILPSSSGNRAHPCMFLDGDRSQTGWRYDQCCIFCRAYW